MDKQILKILKKKMFEEILFDNIYLSQPVIVNNPEMQVRKNATPVFLKVSDTFWWRAPQLKSRKRLSKKTYFKLSEENITGSPSTMIFDWNIWR